MLNQESIIRSAKNLRVFLLGTLLAVATVALYWPATHYDFVTLDDNEYVYENPWVTSGLSWSTIKWSLTTTYAANWHPLTWISHLLDTSIFGALPDGPHLTNLILHSLDSLLLFLVLIRLTGSLWPSFMVAALFAWHPLHVESVAWVSERKDVLSAMWWISAIWAYARAAHGLKGPIWSGTTAVSKAFYGLSIFLFALGLMSKPMVVTLPFVLLLLDYWPLNRWPTSAEQKAVPRGRKVSLQLLAEKVPFYLLAAVDCVVTVAAQRSSEAIKSLNQVPLISRVLNWPIAYAFYIEKTLWPRNLCAFYKLSITPLPMLAVAAGLALAGISVFVIVSRQRYPWLLVGWLWFLGTLVPVIGLVQVGGQAAADRYMYLPSIGLFIMVAWGVNEAFNKWPEARHVGFAVVAGVLLCSALGTQWQMTCWRNSLALYSRILEINDCDMAHNGLGMALSAAGRKDEAIEHFKEALRLNPSSIHAHYNLGIELAGVGKLDEALAQFSAALKLDPASEKLQNNLGVILVQQGKSSEALDHFNESIRLNPVYPNPYFNRAKIFQSMGDFGSAATNYNKALQLEPGSPETLNQLALLLATCPEARWRDPVRAVNLAQQANTLTYSTVPDYLRTLAVCYASAGQYSNALATAEQARQRAEAKGLTALTEKIEHDIKSYEGKKR